MSISILLQKLQDIGLNHSEARVYLATLEAGNAPASSISKNANMNRISTYSILKRLVQMGMVHVIQQQGMQYFQALAPEILVSQAQERATSLEKSLPLLQSLAGNNIGRPMVQFFEGIESVQKVYMQTLTAHTEILNYANSQNIRDHWEHYDQEYVQKRAEQKIYLRGLAPNDSSGKKVHGRDPEFHREIRLLEATHFQVENEINIFDNKVLIASFDPIIFAILIESEPIAQTQRQIFEITWEFAGMFSEKNC